MNVRSLIMQGMTISSTPPTRIAIAGAGMIGQAHIAALARCPELRLSALVDPSPAAVVVAERAGVPLYPTLDTLLAHDRPDGLLLATPNALHVPQALQCVAAGLPILLEKPIATTVAEGRTLLAAVESSGARVLIGHHRAHSPIMAKAREVVQSGQLGRLVAVMGSATFYKPDHYFAEGPWRTQPGGGPVLLNMIHEVHNLRMLCGDIVAVQAISSNAVRGHAVEDTMAISLRFASGALGTFLLSDTAACPRSWSRPRRKIRRTPPMKTKTATYSPARAAASRCRPCGSRPTRVQPTALGGNRLTAAWYP